MRRAIIHVGMPRTASTTVQHVLAHLRPELDAAGILYPDLTPRSAAEPHISHQHLGEALDGRRPRAEARELLDDLSRHLTATKADTLILSYEDWIQEKRALAIAATLKDVVQRHGFRMEAVVVAKPQDEHLNSIYSHRAQLMREKRLFAGFCRGFEGSGRFAYAELMDPWLAACDGQICGLPLRDRRSDAPLMHRFLIELGLADRVLPLLDAAATTRVENRSPGPVAVEVSRRLRRLRVPSRLRIRPRAAMREIERDVAALGLDRIPFKGVTPAQRTRLAQRFRATNDRFAHALWGTDWDSVVAPEREHPVNEIGGHPVPQETEAVIQDLVRDACARLNVATTSPWYRPLAEAAEDAADAAQRLLRLSSWRVI